MAAAGRRFVEWTASSGTLHLVERIVPDVLAGKPISYYDHGDSVRVVGLIRGGQGRVNIDGLFAQEDDVLEFLVTTEGLEELSHSSRADNDEGDDRRWRIGRRVDCVRPRGPSSRRHLARAGLDDRRTPQSMLPGVNVMAADACEYANLAAADLRSVDVVIAATGDDEDNLVISWLSKQEFGVPRVISRINNSRNEWLFNESWGVDISSRRRPSSPRWSTRPSKWARSLI